MRTSRLDRGATGPEHVHQPRRRFSQNFLHDPGVIARIVAAIAPTPIDQVLEIGPGKGALTAPLLATGARVDAVEIDRDLANALRQRFADRPRFTLHLGDALRFEPASVVTGPATLRVVGNLPYHISTPLLFHLIQHRDSIRDIHVMLQSEVVDRMVATPGSHDYGRLGVMVGLWCDAERLFKVGSGAFQPAPAVTSAVVRLRVREHPAVDVGDEQMFHRVVADAFSQRRKTLRNSLSRLLDADAIRAVGIDPGARAETIDLAGFGALSRAATERRSPT